MRANNRKLISAVGALLAAALLAAALRGPDRLPQAPARQLTEAAEVGTPGFSPKTGRKSTPSAPPVSSLQGKLLITELMEKNRAVLPDEDGDFPDWIELYNCSNKTVSLKGMHISDRIDRYGWDLPEGELAPGEYLLIFASGKDRRGEVPHTDFALSERDYVCLFDKKGGLIDSVRCRGCEADVSLALGGDGEWEESLYPTPGRGNTVAGYVFCQRQLDAAGPLVINEVVVANFGRFTAGLSSECDWVEIKNISDAPVELSDYYLSDKADKRLLWRFPAEVLLPGARMLVVCDDDPDGFYGSVPCTGFALDSSHDRLYLSDGGGALIDWASLRDIPAGGSYGRMDGRPGFFYFAEATPGRDNTDGCRTVSPMPVSLTADGVYEDAEEILLRLEGGGTLRYTVNGDAPTAESEVYTGPIPITETCVVRVRSFSGNALPSRTLALSFILNEGNALPVVSFAADDPRAFSGVYASGAKTDELEGTLALFREGDSFHVRCGASLNGETSLILTKKNIAIHLRGAYGQETLEHDIFGGGATSFHALLLRAGQDQYQAVIRNELAQSLAEKAGCRAVNQRSIFCALYLNGEYAGLYTLKERPNASLYAAAAGVDRKSVEIFEAPAAYGSEFSKEIVEFAIKNDMSDADNYRRFCALMDIDGLIDWLFFEGFTGNTDVTSGNLRFARSDDADGRWHPLFYDLDAAFRNYESVQTNLLNQYGASNIQVAAFSVQLMENADFRDRFLTRAAELLRGPLSNEAVLAEIDRLADEIRPEIARDYARVGKDPASWEWNLEQLRSLIRDHDWCRLNIEGLCQSFELEAEERERYFGDLDAPKPE